MGRPQDEHGIGRNDRVNKDAQLRRGNGEVSMASGKVRYWAAAKSAAGVAEEAFEAATLGELMTKITAGRAELARVVSRSSFLIDGSPVGKRPHGEVVLHDGVTVEVLPPFAGG
jgi:molybdopterin synthase sulfur carrier subunit